MEKTTVLPVWGLGGGVGGYCILTSAVTVCG